MCHIKVVLHKIGRLYVLPASRGISSLKARLEGNTPRRAIRNFESVKNLTGNSYSFLLFFLVQPKGAKQTQLKFQRYTCVYQLCSNMIFLACKSQYKF